MIDIWTRKSMVTSQGQCGLVTCDPHIVGSIPINATVDCNHEQVPLPCLFCPTNRRRKTDVTCVLSKGPHPVGPAPCSLCWTHSAFGSIWLFDREQPVSLVIVCHKSKLIDITRQFSLCQKPKKIGKDVSMLEMVPLIHCGSESVTN